jgi:hypothetical protein
MPKTIKLTLIWVFILPLASLIFVPQALILAQDKALTDRGGQDAQITRKGPGAAIEYLKSAAIYQNAQKTIKKFWADFIYAAGKIKDFIYSLMVKFYKSFYWPENLEQIKIY